ncbi:helix-turn-helix domain-containing protein [Novosphingopyxis sp.]
MLGVTRATLSTLLNERAHLLTEMALRIEKAFGVSMDADADAEQFRHCAH